jgi:long-chain fatty acid transport protein
VKIKKHLAALIISLLPTTISLAAGFNLLAESASALGEGLAGGAAEAEDATTNYYNPAGFVRLPCPTFSGSGIAVVAKPRYSGSTTGTYDVFGSQTAQGNASTLVKALVTGTYYVQPLVDDWIWIGVGMTAPSGLSANYPNQSATRYALTLGKLQTINLNFNVGFRLNCQLSLGYGVDIIRGDSLAKTNIVNPFDSTSDWNFALNVHGYAMGLNLGLLYQPCETTRFGVSYRGRIPISMQGTGDLNTQGIFTAIPGAPLHTNNLEMRFTIPDITYFSFFHQLTPRIDIMSTIIYEMWSAFNNIRVTNFPVPLSSPTDITIRENFQNTISASVGARYQFTDTIKLKGGLGYVPSAVKDSNRNLIIPSNASWIVSLGAHYQFNRCLSFDVAYAHPFFKRARVNYGTSNTVNTIFFPVTYTLTESGISRGRGEFLGTQLNYVFD